MQSLRSIEIFQASFFHEKMKIMKIMKILKIMIFSRPWSQKTILKPRSAAPRRNVQITCRGEDSLSESNTPPRESAKDHSGSVFRGFPEKWSF